MLVIGLTGGIGSGKSTVAKMFHELGVPIYYADIEAKKLMTNSVVIQKKIINRFGKEAYKNGELNRPFLANLIFTNKENLHFVNSVVHPEIHKHFTNWIEKQEDTAYVIQENAILFENESNVLFDKIITVTAPIKVKIDRVIERDNIDKNQVLDRMKNQWPDAKKIEKSDYTINNIHLLKTKEAVKKIHNKLCKK